MVPVWLLIPEYMLIFICHLFVQTYSCGSFSLVIHFFVCHGKSKCISAVLNFE